MSGLLPLTAPLREILMIGDKELRKRLKPLPARKLRASLPARAIFMFRRSDVKVVSLNRYRIYNIYSELKKRIKRLLRMLVGDE